MGSGELREHLVGLLEERDVLRAQQLVDELGDTELHGALAVIRRYDAESQDSAGLLVYRLKHSDLTRYKPAEQRTAATDPSEGAAPTITPRLIQSVKAGCSTPDGITRDEARGMYDTAARARGVPVDELIDMAMGTEWLETKPHPAKDPENPERAAAYARWLS